MEFLDTEYQRVFIREMSKARQDELLNIIKKDRAYDPSIFEDSPPFFFPVEASSTRLDSYFTWMDESTLRNYVQAFNDGISIQDSHKSSELGFGRSITGSLVAIEDQPDRADREIADTEKDYRVYAELYTIPGIKLGANNTTDDMIRGIRSGLIKDGSVGFYGGFWECSICQNDVRDWWGCSHIPGFRYELDPESDEKGQTTIRQKLCTARIKGANLSEFSLVYDGATPNAGIMKAERLLAEGKIDESKVNLIEQRYRVAFKRKPKQVSIATLPTQPSISTGKTEHLRKPVKLEKGEPRIMEFELTDELRTLYRDLGAPMAATDEEVVRWSVKQIESQRARIAELQPKAKDGETYRLHLIDETLKEFTRAFGSDADIQSEKTMLESLTLDHVRKLSDRWKKIAAERFPGGRATGEGTEPPETTEDDENDNRYKAR